MKEALELARQVNLKVSAGGRGSGGGWRDLRPGFQFAHPHERPHGTCRDSGVTHPRPLLPNRGIRPSRHLAEGKVRRDLRK